MTTITIVIAPRERYYGILECIDAVYDNTDEAFNLIIPDVGYPTDLIAKIVDKIANFPDAEIMDFGGMVIPMVLFKTIVPKVTSDVLVCPNWLPPLLESIDAGASFVSPLILEKEGVDQGAEIRNHLYTSKILVVEYNGEDYLIESKEYRRELLENIPNEIRTTETFDN